MQEQIRRDDQNQGNYGAPVSDTTQEPAAQSRGFGGGHNVMGNPTNPSSQEGAQGYAGDPAQYSAGKSTSGGSYNAPPSGGGAGAASYPGDGPQNSQTPNQMPGQATSGTPQSQTTDGAPAYVQTSPTPGGGNKSPMDALTQAFGKWGKRAEDMTGNVWGHLRTGPNVADTALGRMSVGAKAISEGGMENVYRQNFDVAPDERLLKTYACYLSTSTGLVAGTLFISNQKLAFGSDRPLAIPNSPTAQNQNSPDKHGKHSKKANAELQQQQQQDQQMVYYKVTIPISQLQSVEPSENLKKKQPEKYIQVKTVDGHEFWFMGFVNYDKGVKNLQGALATKQTSAASNNDPAGATAMGTNTNQTNAAESTNVSYTPATSTNRDVTMDPAEAAATQGNANTMNPTSNETATQGNTDPMNQRSNVAGTQDYTNPPNYSANSASKTPDAANVDGRYNSGRDYTGAPPDNYKHDGNYSSANEGYNQAPSNENPSSAYPPTNEGYNTQASNFRGDAANTNRPSNTGEAYNAGSTPAGDRPPPQTTENY